MNTNANFIKQKRKEDKNLGRCWINSNFAEAFIFIRIFRGLGSFQIRGKGSAFYRYVYLYANDRSTKLYSQPFLRFYRAILQCLYQRCFGQCQGGKFQQVHI